MNKFCNRPPLRSSVVSSMNLSTSFWSNIRMCVCVCGVFFFLCFFWAWIFLLRQWRGIRRVSTFESRESTRQKIKMELQTNSFLSIHSAKKIMGCGVTGTHEICALPKKKFTRSCCCCAQVFPCATNRAKKLWTIELIVCWVALFRAQLPSLCIFISH